VVATFGVTFDLDSVAWTTVCTSAFSGICAFDVPFAPAFLGVPVVGSLAGAFAAFGDPATTSLTADFADASLPFSDGVPGSTNSFARPTSEDATMAFAAFALGSALPFCDCTGGALDPDLTFGVPADFEGGSATFVGVSGKTAFCGGATFAGSAACGAGTEVLVGGALTGGGAVSACCWRVRGDIPACDLSAPASLPSPLLVWSTLLESSVLFFGVPSGVSTAFLDCSSAASSLASLAIAFALAFALEVLLSFAALFLLSSFGALFL